jgi:hypothetical protein
VALQWQSRPSALVSASLQRSHVGGREMQLMSQDGEHAETVDYGLLLWPKVTLYQCSTILNKYSIMSTDHAAASQPCPDPVIASWPYPVMLFCHGARPLLLPPPLPCSKAEGALVPCARPDTIADGLQVGCCLCMHLGRVTWISLGWDRFLGLLLTMLPAPWW